MLFVRFSKTEQQGKAGRLGAMGLARVDKDYSCNYSSKTLKTALSIFLQNTIVSKPPTDVVGIFCIIAA